MKYNTVVIDFPWPISLTGKTKVRKNRRTKLPYKTMTIEEIEDFPLYNFANRGAHVYIWFTNKTMPDFPYLLEKLGIHFHTILTWVKPNGIPPCYTYKFATEYCVLGFYGKPMLPFNRNKHGDFEADLNWVKADSGEHSTKPNIMYELIRKQSPDPRVDIFARQRHDGFDAIGDQVEPLLQKTLVTEGSS